VDIGAVLTDLAAPMVQVRDKLKVNNGAAEQLSQALTRASSALDHNKQGHDVQAPHPAEPLDR
jgi:hypothetical protein